MRSIKRFIIIRRMRIKGCNNAITCKKKKYFGLDVIGIHRGERSTLGLGKGTHRGATELTENNILFTCLKLNDLNFIYFYIKIKIKIH
jgi:hypothetical protein